jgi:hypothetical protein
MTAIRSYIACSILLLAGSAHAQWQTENYELKGGWNAIYLHGEATHATIDALFPNSGATANVEEVWRWNPNSNQVQFTTTPLLPSSGTPEWSVWKRGGAANSLLQVTGQSAYLVKCTGNATVSIVQRPLPPSAEWVRNGANLLGFPTKGSGIPPTSPSFSTYFASFPAAIAANTKVFKYVGGNLSSSNPLQVFAPTAERLDRNQAYWFSSEVVGNFYAPVQISVSSRDGLNFGRTGSIITMRVLNRLSSTMTIRIEPVVSNAAPAGQEAITGSVPVTRRTFDGNTASWVETPIAAAYTEAIAPQSSIELSFGIDRTAMSGAPEAFFASMLRFTDFDDLFDILIPATARKSSLAGLWIGDAVVTAVESKAQANAVTPTGRGYPLRYLLHVADDGTARILSQVFLGTLATLPNDFGICTKESELKADVKADAVRIVSAHLPLDRVLDGVVDSIEKVAGTGSVAIPGTLTRTIGIPFDDPTNPFVHQYHPDHDNKDARGNPLGSGFESYDVEREVTFTFTATPPAGSSVTTDWGSSVIGGTYAEVIQGLHKDSIGVGTGDGLHITGTFELRRASEIGSITAP